MATLPVPSAIVWVGPPLSASEPSLRSACAHLSDPARAVVVEAAAAVVRGAVGDAVSAEVEGAVSTSWGTICQDRVLDRHRAPESQRDFVTRAIENPVGPPVGMVADDGAVDDGQVTGIGDGAAGFSVVARERAVGDRHRAVIGDARPRSITSPRIGCVAVEGAAADGGGAAGNGDAASGLTDRVVAEGAVGDVKRSQETQNPGALRVRAVSVECAVADRQRRQRG